MDIEKIITNDKFLHFIVGIGIMLVGSLVIGPLLAVFATILGAVLKEMFDLHIQKEEFDFFDMFATVVGIFPGAMLYEITKYFGYFIL